MLTATAVCRRASSIKVRISINNLRGVLALQVQNLVASSSYYVHRVLCYLVDLGIKCSRWSGGELPGFFVGVPARNLCNRLLHNCGGRNERVWADPRWDQPFGPLLKSLSQRPPIVPVLADSADS
jgi:hypothetical protein